LFRDFVGDKLIDMNYYVQADGWYLKRDNHDLILELLVTSLPWREVFFAVSVGVPIVGSLMKKVENPFLNRELSVSLQRDLVPGAVAPGEKGTGCESRTDGAAVCSRW